MEFEECLKELLNRENIQLNEEQIKELCSFKGILTEWNEKINLTTIKEDKDIVIKHFIDSLKVLEYMSNDARVADLGTGAGFPGIPLKIANKDLDITLIDSVNKKITYLQDVIKRLNLSKINAIHGRFEDLAQDRKYRESFDIVVSRALANMTTLMEYSLPFLKVGGKCICMKGPNVEEEVKESLKAIEILGGKLVKINEYTLPDIDVRYNIVIVEKVKNTDGKYPRKAGKPTSDPLK